MQVVSTFSTPSKDFKELSLYKCNAYIYIQGDSRLYVYTSGCLEQERNVICEHGLDIIFVTPMCGRTRDVRVFKYSYTCTCMSVLLALRS